MVWVRGVWEERGWLWKPKGEGCAEELRVLGPAPLVLSP